MVSLPLIGCAGSQCFLFIFQSFFGIGQGAEISIELSDGEKRRKVDVKNEEGKKDKLPLYFDGESVSGRVQVTLKGRKLEHQGIRVEFIGQIGTTTPVIC